MLIEERSTSFVYANDGRYGSGDKNRTGLAFKEWNPETRSARSEVAKSGSLLKQTHGLLDFPGIGFPEAVNEDRLAATGRLDENIGEEDPVGDAHRRDRPVVDPLFLRAEHLALAKGNSIAGKRDRIAEEQIPRRPAARPVGLVRHPRGGAGPDARGHGHHRGGRNGGRRQQSPFRLGELRVRQLPARAHLRKSLQFVGEVHGLD